MRRHSSAPSLGTVDAADRRTRVDLTDPTRAGEWPAALRLPEGTRSAAVVVASTTVIR